ncbi:MAG: hypothetical protein LIO81_02300 [Clostridiales bacterium]|nr:hypothetical protein [Clostridiales bacterium]
MSNRERVIQLISDIPDNKLVFVVDVLESLRAYAGETIQPDEWDLQMIEQAKQENDGVTVSIDALAAELGIAL